MPSFGSILVGFFHPGHQGAFILLSPWVLIVHPVGGGVELFLESSKIVWLFITKQSLSTEETQALVRAMANVEEVWLGDWGEVTLDISTLVTYGGQGKCKWVSFYLDAARKYREEVRRWAQRISWKVTRDNNSAIFIERN